MLSVWRSNRDKKLANKAFKFQGHIHLTLAGGGKQNHPKSLRFMKKNCEVLHYIITC